MTLSHLLWAETYERPRGALETLTPPPGAPCPTAQDPGVRVERREAAEPEPNKPTPAPGHASLDSARGGAAGDPQVSP